MPDNELANSFMKECIKGERLKHQGLLALYYEVKQSYLYRAHWCP